MNFPSHNNFIRVSAVKLVCIAAMMLLVVACVSHTVASDAAKTGAGSIWPKGATCAVSLSYDDSVPVHHQRVAPLLDQHDLRATFYLSVKDLESPEAWKRVAAHGHELGNHSLFHPCRRDPGNVSWLPDHYDLATYTPERFRDELKIANLVFDLLDGGKPRTYGNNCTNLTIGQGSQEQPMDPILAELFVAARGTITHQPVDPAQPAFTRLGHLVGDAKTFTQLRTEIDSACAHGGWAIYMFHGVGAGTHSLFIVEDEHRQLIEWLDQQRASIWTAPVVDIARYLKERVGTR
jgi:hypothetical protein